MFFSVDRGPKDSPVVIMSLRVDHLGKIHKAEISGQMEYYFTNLGFPEIAGDVPYFSPPFGVR